MSRGWQNSANVQEETENEPHADEEAALTEEGNGGAPSVFIVVLWQSRSISLAGNLHSSWKCAK